MTQRITELENELATLRRTLAELKGHAEAMFHALLDALNGHPDWVRATSTAAADYRQSIKQQQGEG